MRRFVRPLAILGTLVGAFLAVTAFMAGWGTYALSLLFATGGCLVVAIFANVLFPARDNFDERLRHYVGEPRNNNK